MTIGVVVIGRNEGERLQRCLESIQSRSLQRIKAMVYVDSGSTDSSVQIARMLDTEVVELDPKIPFTAGRARNAGFKRLMEIAADSEFVQFVDGDCELADRWLDTASRFLQENIRIAAVCGRLRERFPDQSVYNWLCDREWNGPVGEIKACGGNAMMRACVIEDAGGYREDVIAAEEDELCVRLRAKGWKIWRLEYDMGFHDAAMTMFSQWWRRMMRSGYAFAQGVQLHGQTPEHHFVWESRRAMIWGLILPMACLFVTVLVFPWGTLAWLIYPLQFARQMLRQTGTMKDRTRLAFFQLVGRFAEVLGQLKFARDRLFRLPPQIIEHK